MRPKRLIACVLVALIALAGQSATAQNTGVRVPGFFEGDHGRKLLYLWGSYAAFNCAHSLIKEKMKKRGWKECAMGVFVVAPAVTLGDHAGMYLTARHHYWPGKSVFNLAMSVEENWTEEKKLSTILCRYKTDYMWAVGGYNFCENDFSVELRLGQMATSGAFALDGRHKFLWKESLTRGEPTWLNTKKFRAGLLGEHIFGNVTLNRDYYLSENTFKREIAERLIRDHESMHVFQYGARGRALCSDIDRWVYGKKKKFSVIFGQDLCTAALSRTYDPELKLYQDLLVKDFIDFYLKKHPLFLQQLGSVEQQTRSVEH